MINVEARAARRRMANATIVLHIIINIRSRESTLQVTYVLIVKKGRKAENLQ